ncbi:hypothetical protein O4H53_02970 [Sulfitobacter sp. G21635-S1]|uniref:hypothetical protein n=1 Tax=Sulfitobacter sp. G21635-S1 TaxID=3014043 RepID=UPI0022B04540|nr:hypothetical protein [Sulfitobacter sp. G21635-S1]MCZ4254486.1 hypothetical protein [Sulfitobacter sp. G21635-S1]
MLTYRPDKFERAFHLQDGAALWDFLRQPENRLRMETATYLGRPAIEPLSPALVQAFGNQVRDHQIRQMIGHMVRQIMEEGGYRLDRSGVRIRRKNNIFFSGSRYLAPDSA